MISIQALNNHLSESNEPNDFMINNLTSQLKKEITPSNAKNEDICISPFIGEDKYPSITVDGKGNTVIIWTNEASNTTSYMGITYADDRDNENKWQNNAIISGLALDNPIKFDIGYMKGDEYSGLAGCYYEKTEEWQGGFNIEDITNFESTFDFWTWNGNTVSNMILCETVDQPLTYGINYPSIIGWWDMLIYDYQDTSHNISQCPVFFRTDALMAGGISYYDAQSHEQTAPGNYADFYVKDTNTIHMVMTNEQDNSIIWRMLKLDEEPDMEYTPYQATIGNGSQTQIAGNKDSVVITYVENNTVKSLYSDDDGTTWQTATIGMGYYPNICEVNGFFFTAFIYDHNLYLTVSTDGGATWSTPEQVNTHNGSVVNESQSMDIHKGGIVWTDNRGSDLDIYYQPLYQVFNMDTKEYFYTIQEAIDDSDTVNGNTLSVSSGIYYENITVNKTVNLIGEDKNNTKIDGNIDIHSENVTLSNFTIFDSTPNDGDNKKIEIHSVENVSILNNNLVNCYIYLLHATNSTVSNNIMANSSYAIWLRSSSFVNVSNNTILNCRDGIFIQNDYSYDGWYNTIKNNSLIGCGIDIYGRKVNHFIQVIDTSNTVDGKPIYYYYDTNDVTVPSDAGDVILVSCNNVIISNVSCYSIISAFSINNTINDNHCFLRLVSSHNNKITGNDLSSANFFNSDQNNLTNNTLNHIYLENCNFNNINQNQLIGNQGNGVYLCYCDHNQISENNITNVYGITLGASTSYNKIYNNHILNCHTGIRIHNASSTPADNNEMYHNQFTNNSINALDESTNFWYNQSLFQGNYWDDYNGYDLDGNGIGEMPYNISSGNNQDLYPFIHSYGWLIELDINQSIHDRGFPIRHAADGDWGAAQNFKANYDILSYTQIYIRKFGTPEFNLTVELREGSINGPVINTLIFLPSEIPSSWTWLELDFTDVPITPENNYFIKCPPAPNGITTSFGYEWGYAFGNQYDDGAFWFTRDGGGLWRDLPTMYEFEFRTFGYN